MNAADERELVRSASVGIAALRVWLGAWFLLTGALKLPVWLPGLDFSARMFGWLGMAAGGGAHPLYQSFLWKLNAHIDAVIWAVAVLELLIGIGLVLGLFTRTAATAAIVLYANYWLATAHMGFAATGVTLTIAVTAACLWIGNAGLFYGIDGFRARRARSTLAPPINPRT